LYLQNNKLRSLEGLPEIMEDVMWNSTKLIWIDLSYNELVNIDSCLLEFPNLKCLYMHKNYIRNLDEVKKLQRLPDLQSLTLYGNDIEQI